MLKTRYDKRDAIEAMALALYDYFKDERKRPVGKYVCIQMAEAAFKVLGERFTKQQ